jgi:hypothetical protein
VSQGRVPLSQPKVRKILDTTMQIASPVVLEYLRSEMAVHKWQHAIAVVPAEAAIGLPRFRIILVDRIIFYDEKWAGRAEKIFVIVSERMRGDGKTATVLRSFVDYEFERWSEIQLDEMVVYSQ